MARLGDELFVVLAAGENGLFSFSAAMSRKNCVRPIERGPNAKPGTTPILCFPSADFASLLL